jgi:sulfide:quinone oxidoreductase
MFGVNEYNPVLNAEADARGVKRHHQTVLVSVNAEKKEATFREIGGEKEGTEVTMPFAMLHVTPPMSVPEVLKGSTLLNESVSLPMRGRKWNS